MTRIWIKGGTGFVVYVEDPVPEFLSAHHKRECLDVPNLHSVGSTSNNSGLFTGFTVCRNADMNSYQINGDMEISGSLFPTQHSSEKQLAENRWSPSTNVFWFKPTR